jgi:hypothetical protein
MDIDRCGRRHWVEGRLFATLRIGRGRLLRLLHRTNSFHPRNAVDHIPFRMERRCVENGKAPRRGKGGTALFTASIGPRAALALLHRGQTTRWSGLAAENTRLS